MRRAAAVLFARFGYASWRDQRGEVLAGLVVTAGFVLTALGAAATVVTIGERTAINSCIARVTTATANLKAKYPGTKIVPQDDIDVLNIQSCRNYVQTLTTSSVGNSGAIKNLGNLVDQGLQKLGKCSILYVTPSRPEAGLTTGIEVGAGIPFDFRNTAAVANITVRGKSISAPLSTATFAYLVVPTDVSANAAGEVSPVTVSATAVVPAAGDGVCIPPSTPQGGQCVLSCTTSADHVVWKNPPVPEIKQFVAQPSTIDAAKSTAVVLSWNVAKATGVTIDQGVGDVDPKLGSTFELPPDQDTTYTLTAFGVRPQDTKTARQTVKVTGSRPLSISITSPSGDARLTNPSVAVTGTVTPAPTAAGSLTATIAVNGVPKVSVPVNTSGSFSSTVGLDKLTPPSDLVVTNPSLGVNACGPQATQVSIDNRALRSSVQNTIEVTVTDGLRQASAAVTVLHVVLLQSSVITWLTCTGENKNQALNTALNPGGSVAVGYVTGGCSAKDGCKESCIVRASVGTSLGTVQADAAWVFNVAGPCQ